MPTGFDYLHNESPVIAATGVTTTDSITTGADTITIGPNTNDWGDLQPVTTVGGTGWLEINGQSTTGSLEMHGWTNGWPTLNGWSTQLYPSLFSEIEYCIRTGDWKRWESIKNDVDAIRYDLDRDIISSKDITDQDIDDILAWPQPQF